MSTLSQFVVPKTKFRVEDIPDLSGKVMIVTGGYSGIGFETTKALLMHDAKVYIAGRNKSKGEEAMKRLRQETGKTELYFLELDLADLPSVKKAAESYLSLETQLHVLFNNGGVMHPPNEQLTAQGYDLQFGTNVIGNISIPCTTGHFYFTKLLLPTLLETAKTSADGKARVVNTSSFGHVMAKGVDYDNLTDTPKRRKMGAQYLYSQSKFGNIVFSAELARRYGDQGLVSTSLNPGNLKTELVRHWTSPGAKLLKLFGHLIVYPAHLGALTQLYAGTTEAGAELNGKYLVPWARIGAARPETQDKEAGKKLWAWLEEQVESIS
ncbi:NAD(P)-binding protein [Mycena sp. CBHHK59/15]|nr:NAD(P)-binding protein [Mycena sp. CBHHK59/15]